MSIESVETVARNGSRLSCAQLASKQRVPRPSGEMTGAHLGLPNRCRGRGKAARPLIK